MSPSPLKPGVLIRALEYAHDLDLQNSGWEADLDTVEPLASIVERPPPTTPNGGQTIG